MVATMVWGVCGVSLLCPYSVLCGVWPMVWECPWHAIVSWPTMAWGVCWRAPTAQDTLT
jgi:hypothetical protein